MGDHSRGSPRNPGPRPLPPPGGDVGSWPGPDRDQWAARLEIYETDPAVEPDMTKWTTQLAFRLSQ